LAYSLIILLSPVFCQSDLNTKTGPYSFAQSANSPLLRSDLEVGKKVSKYSLTN